MSEAEDLRGGRVGEGGDGVEGWGEGSGGDEEGEEAAEVGFVEAGRGEVVSVAVGEERWGLVEGVAEEGEEEEEEEGEKEAGRGGRH